MSPATFETPASCNLNKTPSNVGKAPPGATDTPKSTISSVSKTSTSTAKAVRKNLSEKHSVDSFLQAYTSEDNFSFHEIIESAEEKLRQKFNVLFKQEQLSAEKLARALTLPSIEQQFEEPDPMRKIETWHYTNMNSVMFIPDGVELTKDERIEAVNRRQAIHYNATRLTLNPSEKSSKDRDKAVSNALAKIGQLQVMGNKIDAGGNVVAGISNGAPQIRGFDLVKTPSPRPGEAFSPLMTWGEIEGTPFRLDGSDTPVRSNVGPSFKINENSRRENIALALAEKVGVKMRAQKQRAMDTARKNIGSPFIRSNMERLASISPAARRLASSKLGIYTPLMTPSPLRTPTLGSAKRKFSNASTKQSARTAAAAKVAAAQKSTASLQASTEKPTLTDDLLQIPKNRLKATDFF